MYRGGRREKDINMPTLVYLAHKLNPTCQRAFRNHRLGLGGGWRCLNCRVGRPCLSWSGTLIKMRSEEREGGGGRRKRQGGGRWWGAR